MPFRCKCGRTFEKPDTFSSHTSGCAPFHQRRLSSPAASHSSKVTPLDMSNVRRFSLRPATTLLSPTSTEQPSSSSSLASSPSSTSPLSYSSSSPLSSPSPSSMDYPAFMPTALSIQNAFEGVRRRSLSYGASLK